MNTTHIKTLVPLVLMGCLLMASQAQAVRSIVWDRTAIPIELIVGIEQMVHFPQNGDVGLPPTLANTDIFRTLFTGKTAYWTALQAFDNERIKVRLDRGDFILFDVSARVAKQPPQNREALNIVMAEHSQLSSDNAISSDEAVTVFELLRYATQITYAPARLVDALSVRESPTGLTGDLNTLYDQGQHTGLVLLPDKSWTTAGLWVTSIRVLNQHTHAIALDNRLVQHTRNAHINGVGRHFIASMFYRQQLPPGEKTTLFVVTDQPFQSVIRF